MKREEMLSRLDAREEPWDVVIIGGGASGLGCALDAASRGYATLLVEQSDFAKGTSSRSTKLVHGGVRYLRQGNVTLVTEALKERGRLRRNAPHLVRDLSFVVPHYDWWEGPFYGIGLKLYDMLAGKMGLGPSRWLSREKTQHYIPTVETFGLRGGVIYYDGQFDDARLAVNLARSAADHGAVMLNYMRVTGLMKSPVATSEEAKIGGGDIVEGVIVEDIESGETREVRARAVINATGVFTDGVRKMDDPEAEEIIMASQGVHIVIDQSFLPGESAIMVPETDDGRVLFAIPWHGRTVVGTTDTEVEGPDIEPRALGDEVEFLLEHASRYLRKEVTDRDVLSVFAGLRPLVASGGGASSSSVSRDHTLITSRSGLVTITGGKWTTYRKMAEDTIDLAATVGGLDDVVCKTAELRIHGYREPQEGENPFSGGGVYGSDWDAIAALKTDRPELAEVLHPNLPYTLAEVVWAVRSEMARTLEDVLSRRMRALLLDARASIEIAPKVAEVMATELGRDEAWAKEAVETYEKLAGRYVLTENWRDELDWSLTEL